MGANPNERGLSAWKMCILILKEGLNLGHASSQIFFTTSAGLVCNWLPQGRSKFDPLPGH